LERTGTINLNQAAGAAHQDGVARQVLICTIGITSHVNTLRGMAARLEQEAYRPKFLLQRPDQAETLVERGRQVQLAATADAPRAGGVEAAGDLETVFANCSDDTIVLVDAEWHQALITAMGVGRRPTAVDYHCSPDRLADVPPLSSPRRPAPWPLRRMHCARQWRRTLDHRLGRGVVQKQLEQLRGPARRYGIDLDREASLDGWQPIRFINLDYLCASLVELDFPSSAPRSSLHVGANVDESRLHERSDPQLEEWLEAPDRREAPVVYASLGSLKGSGAWLAAVFEAARLTPQWNWVVHATGLEPAPGTGGTHNLYARPGALPQLRVLSRASAALIGAGIASIHECIATGTPFVAYSLGVLDQNGNAARTGFHGLGEAVFGPSDDGPRMVERLERMMAGGDIPRPLDAFRGHLQRYDTERVLLRAIDALPRFSR